MSDHHDTPSTAELRQQAQNQVEPVVYIPMRRVSIFLSRTLLLTPVTPNMVTLLWGACLLFGAIMLAGGTYLENVLAAGLIALAYILDCVDGELARLSGKGSNLGSTLEQMVHWVTNCAILVGAGAGLFHLSGQPFFLYLTIAALVGDTTFHFMYVSLHVAASPGAKYGLFATITRWQFYVMPINTNLIAIGALADRVDLALWAWAIWANLGWIIGFWLFFVGESRHGKMTSLLLEILKSVENGADAESPNMPAGATSDGPQR